MLSMSIGHLPETDLPQNQNEAEILAWWGLFTTPPPPQFKFWNPQWLVLWVRICFILVIPILRLSSRSSFNCSPGTCPRSLLFLCPFSSARRFTALIVEGFGAFSEFFGAFGFIAFPATPLFLRKESFAKVKVCLDSLTTFWFTGLYLLLVSLIRWNKSSVRWLGHFDFPPTACWTSPVSVGVPSATKTNCCVPVV